MSCRPGVGRWLALAGLVLVLVLAGSSGCSFKKSDHPDACSNASQCEAGQLCYRGFCVPKDDADPTGKPCVAGQAPEFCYDGAEGTQEIGACKAGQRACVGGVYTPCLGQVLPKAEECNSKDDDCDGALDNLADEACSASMEGACQAGTLICQGSMAVCQSTELPVPERCDGLDNDCNGKLDDVGASSCYPFVKGGCVMDGNGAIACQGLCYPGVVQCRDGHGTCFGAVVPRKEGCTPQGLTAADEDCDGTLDEECACGNGNELPCYSGPQGTRDQGACRGGTQTCIAHMWSGCEGEVVPRAEGCDNPDSDDDCNGAVDDVPGLGEICYEPANQGICREGTRRCMAGAEQPACVTRTPEQERCDAVDQDCDGDGYNGFDLGDRLTCGPDCVRCGNQAICCAGSCVSPVSFAEDEANCGQCGNRCGASQFCCQGRCISFDPSGSQASGDALCECADNCGSKRCCGRDCRDLASDEDNCGGCGIACEDDATCCEGVCKSGVCLIGLGLEL